MFLWMLLVVVASSVLATPPRRDVDLHDASTSLTHRLRREIASAPSNIFWIRNTPSHLKKSKIAGKEFNYDDKNRMFKKLFTLKEHRRERRASPSTDAVKDDPASQWLRKSTPKTNFVTGREHRTEKSKETDGDDVPNPALKTNEVVVEPPAFKPRMDRPPPEPPIRMNRYPSEDMRGYPPRRIIYYADLPEVTSRPIESSANQRRFEPVPLRSKYPRDNSHEETFARSKPLMIDRYRDRPSAVRVNSYVDAATERRGVYPARAYNELPTSKFNKIPAPYHRQGDFARNSQPNYENFPARPREPTVSTLRDEPYRDYNPRQPAPWSVQIGTKLTVKDDGRPFRRDDGRPYRQDDGGQRRFYVNSQEAPRFNGQPDDRTRYRLL